MSIKSRLFSICPRIEKKGDRLVATTALRIRLLTLGMWQRQVVVDSQNEIVTIGSCWFWFFRKERRHTFPQITKILYSYDDWGFPTIWLHNSLDLFTIALRLYDGREVVLFRFFGDGEMENQGVFPDWFYVVDTTLEAVGAQESQCYLFAETVSAMTKASIARL